MSNGNLKVAKHLAIFMKMRWTFVSTSKPYKFTRSLLFLNLYNVVEYFFLLIVIIVFVVVV